MEENNKIIANFLNWETINTENCVTYVLPKNLADPIYKLDSRFILEFDTDWNWLMEVVEKILNICSENDDLEKYYIITDNIPYIQPTYNECVKFIKFYNQLQIK
jgi:hypothetical protein